MNFTGTLRFKSNKEDYKTVVNYTLTIDINLFQQVLKMRQAVIEYKLDEAVLYLDFKDGVDIEFTELLGNGETKSVFTDELLLVVREQDVFFTGKLKHDDITFISPYLNIDLSS